MCRPPIPSALFSFFHTEQRRILLLFSSQIADARSFRPCLELDASWCLAPCVPVPTLRPHNPSACSLSTLMPIDYSRWNHFSLSDDDEQQDEHRPARTPEEAQRSHAAPAVDDYVELHSLRSEPALNGRLAVVIGEPNESGRIPVEASSYGAAERKKQLAREAESAAELFQLAKTEPGAFAKKAKELSALTVPSRRLLVNPSNMRLLSSTELAKSMFLMFRLWIIGH